MEESQNEAESDAAQNADELDIFLFSNGEKQSPPRKHHISAGELQSWDNALQSLAQSQFGSEPQTMELYTTSGCKVVDPKQIQNLGTYVAVKPDETFIDAGYDKYLIKATRSRERRQTKKNSTGEPVEPDSSVIKRSQSPTECVKDTVNVQTTDHDLAIETVFSHKTFETQISKNNSTLRVSLTKDTTVPVESRKSSLKPDIAPLGDEKKTPPIQVSVHPNGSQKIPQLHPTTSQLTPILRRQNSPIRSTILSRNRNAYNATVLSMKNQPKMPDKRIRKFTKTSKKVDDRNTSYLGMRHSNITDSSSSIVSTPNKIKLPTRPVVHGPTVTNSNKISPKNKLKHLQADNACNIHKTIKEDNTLEILTRKPTKKGDSFTEFPYLDDLIINKDLIVFAAVRPKRPESITPATDRSYDTELNYEASQEDIESTSCAVDFIEQNKKKLKKVKDHKQLVLQSEKVRQVKAVSKFQPKVPQPTKKKQEPAISDDNYLKKQLVDKFINSNKNSILHDKTELATSKHRELQLNFKTQEPQIENRQVKKALSKELEPSPEPPNMTNKKRDDILTRPITKANPKTYFRAQAIKPFLKTNVLPSKKEMMAAGKLKESKLLSQNAPTLLKKTHPSISTHKASLVQNQSSSNRCETPTLTRLRPFTPVIMPTPVQNKTTFEKNTKMSTKYKEVNSEQKSERKIKIVTHNRQYDPNHKMSFYKQPKPKHDKPLEGNFKADNFGKFQLSIKIPSGLSHEEVADYQPQSKLNQEISAEHYQQALDNTTSHNAPRQSMPSNEIAPDDEWESKEWHKLTVESKQSKPFQKKLLENIYQTNTQGDNFQEVEINDHGNRKPFQLLEPKYTQGSGHQAHINDVQKSETSFIEIFSDNQKPPEPSIKTLLQNEKKTTSTEVLKQRQSELIAFSTALENITSSTRVQKNTPDYLPILTAGIRPLNSFSSDPNSTPKFLKHQHLKPISLVFENHVQPKTCNSQNIKSLSYNSDPYKSHVKSISQSYKSLQSSSISGIPFGASYEIPHCSPEKLESAYEAIQMGKLPKHYLTDNLDMDGLHNLFQSTPANKTADMDKELSFLATPLPVADVELIIEQKKEIKFDYKDPQEHVSLITEATPLITININMEQGTPSSSVTLAMRAEDISKASSLVEDDNKIADETGVVQQSIDLRRSNSDTGVIEKYKNKTKNNGNEMLTQSKSLQSIVNELPDHNCCQKFPKVVIVQCGCCNIGANDGVNHTCKMDSHVVNSKNQECYVVIPVSSVAYSECHKECQCCCFTSDKQTQNSESLAKLKVDNPVNNTSTNMSPDGDTQTQNLSSLCQVYLGNDQNATKYQSVMDNETFHTELMVLRPDLLQNESHCEQFERRISFKPVDCTEKYTQTDWADVLLEIRGHPDGHYTFHLPALQLLRVYGLI